MRIKIFIVTYNNDNVLRRCIESISTNDHKGIMSVTVINNYPTINLHGINYKKLNVINNSVRPIFSTGHLSRNWNQCIMHGLKDIDNPECDILILAQNDVVFAPNFIDNILQHITRYNYLAFGRGDELQIMTPQSIKSIGMYDERFCNIGFQEADYFLRAVLLNKDKSSINDHFHGRVHNPVMNNVILDVPSGYMRNDENHDKSRVYHTISRNVFTHKWAGLLPLGEDPENWTQIVKDTPICPKQYIMYPYFELKLPSITEKYIVY
jgi:hypothetical protein